MITQTLVFLTNEAGDRARVATLCINADSATIGHEIARRHGFVNFDVVRRASDCDDYSDDTMIIVRNGKAQP
jgi:hypothetical protein